jgi:hypothetical integral membrane protein (TIGR02206 family)
LQYFFTYDSEIPAGLAVKNFSSTHYAWLAVTFLLIVLAVLFYRRKSAQVRKKLLRGAALSIVALELVRTAWLLIVGHYELYRHLPLHLCGVMILVEFLAVFTEKRFFKEFAYAAGLPGAAMALLTPEPSGYPLLNIQYLQSILIHALLVLVPLLLIIGENFRPSLRMLPWNFAALTGLAAFCFGVNFLLNSNYMFVRLAPSDTPIALFDQWVGWPGYIGLMLVLVFVFWLFMYLPWEISARRKKARQKSAAAL